MKKRKILGVLATGVVALALPMAVFAASVTPTTHEGNFTDKDCPEGTLAIQIDPPDTEGTADGVTVTVVYNDDNSIDFSAEGGLVMIAVVKGGDNYNLYDYQPDGTDADTNLVSPLNNGGQVPAVSHTVFCVVATETSTSSTTTTTTTTTTSSITTSVSSTTTAVLPPTSTDSVGGPASSSNISLAILLVALGTLSVMLLAPAVRKSRD